MLNQFYNYLSEKLVSYFETTKIQIGDKVYLQFDEEEQVETFNEVLEQTTQTVPFIYQHARGSEYKTYALVINDIKVVVATSLGVTADYLVTLRNQVTEQQGIWKNTALLIVCHSAVDSIYSGMRDLQREGMPLNVKTISKNLMNEIENSKLSKMDKEVTKFYLKKKEEDLFQTTLWDYEEILAILNKAEITKEDYHVLGLFYDKSLEQQYSATQMKNRLQENFELHEKVDRLSQYEDRKAQLEKLFDEKGVKLLSQEDWYEKDFADIKNARENITKGSKSLNYIENDKKLTLEGLNYWEKPKAYTKAGERKRHIIVFNPNKVETVSINFKFDESLRKEFIDSKCQDIVVNSGQTLKVSFKVRPDETVFKKVTYKHNKESKSTYEFNIVVINGPEAILQAIKPLYEVDNKQRRIVATIEDELEKLMFGDGSLIVEESIDDNGQILNLKADTTLRISENSQGWEEASLRFDLHYGDIMIPLEIKEESTRAYPVKSLLLWKYKRENKQDIIFNGVKAIQGVNSFYLDEKFKWYLQLEQEMIDKKVRYGEIQLDSIEKKDLPLSAELIASYEELLDYYKAKRNVPSLVYMDDTLRALCEKYINVFNQEVAAIKENSIFSEDPTKLSLLKLGMLKDGNRILYSSLSPMNVAYQLEMMEQCGAERIETHILERLKPNNLLPYIYGEKDELYRPIYQKDAHEWLVYEKNQNVSLGATDAVIANVVKEKLNQFVAHFKYLFNENSGAPLKINLINIKNDKEVVRGIYQFIRDHLNDKDKKEMIPVEINIYSDAEKSSFDDFFACSTLEKVQEHYDIIINSKQLDPLDVLRLVQENINYYKHPMNKEIEYAHISFYKVGNETKRAKDNMAEIETGLSMDGLLSTVTSVTNRSKYRTGFGIKNVLRPEGTLIQTAIHLNELAVNSENGGDNPYLKAQSIVTKPMEIEEELSEALYEKSHWVTFIEPSFGLEYFDKHSHDLLVIHYSEQYTSSDQYDTITVTNKSKQYKQIIKEFLGRREIVVTDESLESIIKCFNSINGEWLLRIIGSQGEYEREKLSIVSAIKYGLAILDHPEITWIPISMEEILRIAGAVKLNKSEGIFTVKNLKQNGVHSDDLLFIGISQKEDQIKVYYYPVEVKVGYNFSSVVDKGKNQIDNTYKLLREQLSQLEVSETRFKNKFFRNFFMQVLLTNEQKLSINEVWTEKHLEKIEELKAKLVNDAYQMTYALESYIGKGALISFKKDNSWKSIVKEDGKLLVELTEEDAYFGIAKTVQALKEEIQGGKTDIPVEKLLSTISLADLQEEEKVFNQEGEIPQKAETIHKVKSIDEEPVVLGTEETVSIPSINQGFEDTVIDKEEVLVDISEVAVTNEKLRETIIQRDRSESIKPTLVVDENLRALIGEIEGSKHKVYWEFGHKGLGNRHMLIQGKSGQGKTYFIQCLLKELVEQGVPSLIVDYTDGFKASKLETEFKECLGDRLVQYLVAKDKFPLNPFRKNQKELDEDLYVDEDSVDIAERFKSIISAVYKDLGVQQLNCIYQAVLRGLEKYGSKMNLKFLRAELEEDTAASAKTALAQLSLLIDKNPFDNAMEFDWSELEQQSGKVIIIQLAGFTRDVQRIITEMLLWDLWHYKVQHGSKDKPFTVVLDEAQNLDFGESSPCTRILTEGRKFGWSAWFATQFLKGQMDTSEINRLQNAEEKIYFCPPDNAISDIAGSFTKDKVAKKEWEDKLTALKKGQCIVYGPTMDETGTLSSAKVMTVNITSLNERMYHEADAREEQNKKQSTEVQDREEVTKEADTKLVAEEKRMIDKQKYPVRVDSWIIASETEALRKVDNSILAEYGSVIPEGMREFFELQEVGVGREVVKLLFNGKDYEAYVMKYASDKTTIFWNADLGEEINLLFADIKHKIINQEVLVAGERAIMRFKKINSERYQISFVRR